MRLHRVSVGQGLISTRVEVRGPDGRALPEIRPKALACPGRRGDRQRRRLHRPAGVLRARSRRGRDTRRLARLPGGTAHAAPHAHPARRPGRGPARPGARDDGAPTGPGAGREGRHGQSRAERVPADRAHGVPPGHGCRGVGQVRCGPARSSRRLVRPRGPGRAWGGARAAGDQDPHGGRGTPPGPPLRRCQRLPRGDAQPRPAARAARHRLPPDADRGRADRARLGRRLPGAALRPRDAAAARDPAGRRRRGVRLLDLPAHRRGRPGHHQGRPLPDRRHRPRRRVPGDGRPAGPLRARVGQPGGRRGRRDRSRARHPGAARCRRGPGLPPRSPRTGDAAWGSPPVVRQQAGQPLSARERLARWPG